MTVHQETVHEGTKYFVCDISKTVRRTLVVKLHRTVYFVIIDKKRYNLEMAETQKK